MSEAAAAAARAQQAFLRACTLDVAVPKPGNVSVASPGHRMTAAQFIASAEAAAPALCRIGARVGERIEAAVAATWAVVDCNTNLGIVLLCAPLAAAAERVVGSASADDWRAAVGAVLGELDVADAAAAFRAIACANPGGLGDAPAQDVRAAPSVGLREAMAMAAARDRIAAQYATGFADVFDTGLPAFAPASAVLQRWSRDAAPPTALAHAVQRCWLALLGAFPDSHIVRKQGAALAQTVMRQAQACRFACASDGAAWADWDRQLKADAINPGTTADLTVASLMLAGLLDPGQD